MGTRLLRRNVTPGHHVLHNGVVPGQAGDPVLIDVIGPAIADVQQIGHIVHDEHRHHGSAHTPAVRVSAGTAENSGIGRGRSLAQDRRRASFVTGLHALQGVHEGLHCDQAGNIASLCAAHAVTYHTYSQMLRRHV